MQHVLSCRLSLLLNGISPFRYFFAYVLLLHSAILCGQTTVVLNPVKDNTLYESATGSLSNGTGENLFIGRTSTGTTPDFLKRRAIMKFDVAANVPAGATITNVSLILNMNKTSNVTAFSASVHTVNADWGEGNSNAGGQEGTGIAPATNDATWIHRFFNSTNWTNAGGDFNSTPSSTLNVSNTGNYTWTSSQLTADVQNWLDNPSTNNGWIIIGNETSTHTAKRFASRENPTTSVRPKLSITYTVPCIDPVITSFVSDNSETCPGESVELTITGALNSATTWRLYTGGCGTTLVTSSATGVFNVSPSLTTTYYVRGEDGCVAPGSCSNATITVLPLDNPAFSYGALSYCKAGTDPTPTITGTSGGTFSYEPSGLSINASTGAIDLSASVPNTYIVTYTTNLNCSASSQSMISVFDEDNTTAATGICNGDSYIFGSQTLTTGGIYTEVFQSETGCDSTVTLSLNVFPIYDRAEVVSICGGENFIFGSQTLTSAGVFEETFESISGCDSTVTLTLTVNPVYSKSETAVICAGESFILGSQTLTTSGVFTEVFQTVLGCDSTIMLTLIVNETYNETEVVSICAGESFVFAEQTLTTSGVYEEVFQSAQGCDSTVTLLLTVNPTYDTEEVLSICAGESIVFGSQTLTTAGVFSETFESILGCDSTVVLTLSLNSIFNEAEEITICEGDEYVFGTQTLTTAGEYVKVFQSVLNCDSTVVLTLNVNEVDESVIRDDLTLIANAIGATFQWIDCDNANAPIVDETGNSFTVFENGNYAVEVTQNGCTNVSPCFEVIVVGLENDLRNDVLIYPNPVNDNLTIEVGEKQQNVWLEVFNAHGQRMQAIHFGNRDLINLNLTEYKSGLYFVRVRLGSVMQTFKVLKN
jgi:hypothetical protein